METSKVKRYTAILEIVILLAGSVYIINKLLLDNHIADVSNNFNEHRQNPATIITAGLYGKSSRNVLSGIIGQKITATFKGFLKLFNPIFKMFAKMLSKFQGSINGIRGMLRPIRNYFNNTAKMFYDKIQKFTIGILYSMHKMRNSMRRSMSGFNIMMHTLEHTKNSMESIVTSPPVELAVKFLSRAEWIADKGSDLFCFDADTYIKLQDESYKRISQIELGDILEDGAEVVAVQEFANKNTLYKYGHIYLSGGHIVKEDNNWTTVNKSRLGTATYVSPPYLFCLSTTTGNIQIDGILFKDYEGSVNKFVNMTINSLILTKLNSPDKAGNMSGNMSGNKAGNKAMGIYSYGPDYLENGFHPDTFIEMATPALKSIKNIKIGDILIDTNKVIGKVRINPKYIKYYKDTNGNLVTSNTKIQHNGIWKNVELLPDILPETGMNDTVAYNIITESSTIQVNGNNVYRDYIELQDEYIESQIEKLVLLSANMFN
tara:strand:+ start:435 stop:1901 length:1467 start_codon:yes stop_codon:yes gene_type:complete